MLCMVVPTSHRRTTTIAAHLNNPAGGCPENPDPPPPPRRCLPRVSHSSRLETLLGVGSPLRRRLGPSPHGPLLSDGGLSPPSPPPGAWPQGPLLSLNRPRPSEPSPV